MIKHDILKQNTSAIHYRLQELADKAKKLTEENKATVANNAWMKDEVKKEKITGANSDFYKYANEKINYMISLVDEIIKSEKENENQLDLNDTALQNAVKYIETLLESGESISPAIYEPFAGNKQALLLLRGTMRKNDKYKAQTPIDKYIFNIESMYEKIKELLFSTSSYMTTTLSEELKPFVIEGYLNQINNAIFKFAELLGVKYSDTEKKLDMDMTAYARSVMGIPVQPYM